MHTVFEKNRTKPPSIQSILLILIELTFRTYYSSLHSKMVNSSKSVYYNVHSTCCI